MGRDGRNGGDRTGGKRTRKMGRGRRGRKKQRLGHPHTNVFFPEKGDETVNSAKVQH